MYTKNPKKGFFVNFFSYVYTHKHTHKTMFVLGLHKLQLHIGGGSGHAKSQASVVVATSPSPALPQSRLEKGPAPAMPGCHRTMRKSRACQQKSLRYTYSKED